MIRFLCLAVLVLAACSPPSNPSAGTGEIPLPPTPVSHLVLESEGIRPRDFDESMAAAIEAASRRLRAGGVTDATIVKQPDGRLRVDAPGADQVELDHIAKLMGVDSEVTFNLVDMDAKLADYQIGAPLGGRIALPNISDGGFPEVVFTNPIVTNGDFASADAGFDAGNQPMVSFKLTPEGARKFAAATAKNVDRRFAIVFDGLVMSAPTIRAPVTGGAGQIQGQFSAGEAEQMAAAIRSTSMTRRLKTVESVVVRAPRPAGQ